MIMQHANSRHNLEHKDRHFFIGLLHPLCILTFNKGIVVYSACMQCNNPESSITVKCHHSVNNYAVSAVCACNSSEEVAQGQKVIIKQAVINILLLNFALGICWKGKF